MSSDSSIGPERIKGPGKRSSFPGTHSGSDQYSSIRSGWFAGS
jgi:hypothetical protein